MALRANNDPKYFRRFLLIAAACLAFAGWCFYDALVAYPAELERSKVYWTPVEGSQKKYTGLSRKEWTKVVKERQWASAQPETPDKMHHKIDSQYFFAALCGLVGIPCLIKWFMSRGTWVESTEKELSSSWGTRFAFDQIVSIDKTKWEKKGITKIKYKQDDKEKTFVFDDFKYERSVMSDILHEIETGLKDDQIIGAERETEIKARKAAKKASEEAAAQSATATAPTNSDEA